MMIEGVLPPAFRERYEPCRRAYEAAVGKRRACARACEDENSELQQAQGDAAQGSCRVARAVESGWRGGGAHASVLGRWRREPEVVTRALLGSAGGEVGGSAQGLLDNSLHDFSTHIFLEIASPTASRHFF